jgi:hypothetical protein
VEVRRGGYGHMFLPMLAGEGLGVSVWRVDVVRCGGIDSLETIPEVEFVNV